LAKVDMKCPFSGRLCQSCPIYVGRHYYLCFKPLYRGHIPNQIKKDSLNGSKRNYEIPVIKTGAMDPFASVETILSKGGTPLDDN
jgi:hypothetical protein